MPPTHLADRNVQLRTMRVASALGAQRNLLAPEEADALLQEGKMTETMAGGPSTELRLLFHLDDLSTLDDPGEYASQDILMKLATATGNNALSPTPLFRVFAWESEDRVQMAVLVPADRHEDLCNFMEEYRDYLEDCETEVSDEARSYGPQAPYWTAEGRRR